MLKQSVSKFIRKKMFYRFWRKLYEISIYGMNMGPASGYPHYSGEEWIIHFVKNRITSPFPVIFDVGANRGDYAAAVIRAFGSRNFSLHCFEPSESAFELLRERFSNCPNVNLHNFGFGDKVETVKLHSLSEGIGSASIMNTFGHALEGPGIVEEIQLTTLDEFCRERLIRRIDFMKMDVEGYELRILEGGNDFIHSGAVEMIQFEFGFPSIESRVFFKDIFYNLSGIYRIYRSLFDGLVEVDHYDYKDELYDIQNFLAVSKTIR